MSAKRNSALLIAEASPQDRELVQRIKNLLKHSNFELPNVISFPIGVQRKIVPTRMGNH